MLGSAAASAALLAGVEPASGRDRRAGRPNVVLVFADQWRAQAAGYAGDPNLKTPNLDRFAGESVNCVNAVAGCPVCSPYRASLITGQYPHTHGVFVNDVHLSDKATSIAEAFGSAGYDTAYIGKWHLDGRGRSSFIPRESRQGFCYWKALECTHDYNHSPYFGDSPEKLYWDGYDAIAQTRDAVGYIGSRKRRDRPFFLVLSWGPPHNPYETAPEQFKRLYDPGRLALRPNVPPESAPPARQDLAGYYAHCSALDWCFGEVLKAVENSGRAEDTVVIFTSDHGDMLGSHGETSKQRPYEESITVPFLLRYPRRTGRRGRVSTEIVNAPDVMPTILGLCGLDIPPSVEGTDLSRSLLGEEPERREPALIACYQPFGEWTRAHGGREYRGLRTERYTYVRTLEGPWLLYDNKTDPYQLENLCGQDSHAKLQSALDRELTCKLNELGDEFLPGDALIRKWGYTVDKTGTVPYTP